jgi:hypothetical protein
LRLADKILEMESGIRFVLLADGGGNVVEKQVRYASQTRRFGIFLESCDTLGVRSYF